MLASFSGAVLSSEAEITRGRHPGERLSLRPDQAVAAAELHRHHLHRRSRRFLGSQVPTASFQKNSPVANLINILRS